MPLPLIYHDDYSPEFPADHRFPMDKFRLLRDHLVDSGLTEDSQLLRPELCPAEILALAHEPGYIERYLSGELSREDQRRLGLPGTKPWPGALCARSAARYWPPNRHWNTAWPATWRVAPIMRITITRPAFASSMTSR